MSVWEGGNNNRGSRERQRAQLGVEDEYGEMCYEQKDTEEEKNKHMTKEEEVGENERDKKNNNGKMQRFPTPPPPVPKSPRTGCCDFHTVPSAGPHVEHHFRERSKVTYPTENMDAFIYFKL